jgi:hypothetical protein
MRAADVVVGRLESNATAFDLRSLPYVFATGVIIVGALLFHTRSRHEDWKAAYALVRDKSAPGDLIASSGFEAPFIYYYRRDGSRELVRLGPCSDWTLSLDRRVKDVSPSIDALVGKRKRLWLITQGWGFETKERCDATLKPLLQKQFQEWPVSSAYTEPKYQIVP